MWLCTTIGFYSAVQHRDRPDIILVRARARADLERLLERCALAGHAHAIDYTPSADYPYRVSMHVDAWASAVGDLAADVDYDNFKSAVGERQSLEREHVYHAAWAAFRRIEQEERPAGVAGRALHAAAAGDSLLIELGNPQLAFLSASPAIDLDDDCPGCGGYRWHEGGRACDVCNLDGDRYPF